MLQKTIEVQDDSEPIRVPIVDPGASQTPSRRFQVRAKMSRSGKSERFSVVDLRGELLTLWICGDADRARECALLAAQAMEKLYSSEASERHLAEQKKATEELISLAKQAMEELARG